MSGERILFVDDEEQIRKLMQSWLERRGYAVEVANDGNEALRLIRAKMPDLLITDVNMPNMNGFELARRLRADHRTARMPIVMLSARKQADDILTGYAEGADEYIAKPVEMTVLAAKIEVLLKRLAATGGALTAKRGKVIVFIHGKGGAGATTLAVNTAVALAETKLYKTAVLDLSLEFGNVAMQLNMRPGRTLAELGDGEAVLDDATFATYIIQDRSGVQVCTGSSAPEHAELVTVGAVHQGIDRLRATSDYILVDTPASFTQQTLAAIDTAEGVCVVTEPHLASLKASKDCLEVLEKLSYPKERILLVLNRTTQTGLDTDEVSRFFNRRPDIVIPFTPVFDEAADHGRPMVVLHPDNAASRVLRDLAAQIAVLAPSGR